MFDDFFEFEGRKFPLHKEDKDKYLVFTCIKNENDYVTEFVDYYLNFGFDKIIFCDNNDDDSVVGVLEKYINDGTVEIYDCRGLDSFQVQMYSAFCSKSNYDWCAYFDCDEFLVLNEYSNIKDYLLTVCTDIVSFNWLIFGNNGELEKRDGKVQDRFPKPFTPIMYLKENGFIKSIVRGRKVFEGCWFNGSHTPVAKVPLTRNIGGYHFTTNESWRQYPLRYKHGYIKHYYTKSFEEWETKSDKGWPDGTKSLLKQRFFLLDKPVEIPTKIFELNLFGGYYNSETTKLLEEYDVLNLTASNDNIYCLLQYAVSCMAHTKNHTFMISGKNIDDVTFNILFEYGWITGNRVIFVENDTNRWDCFMRYKTGVNGTYYILDLK